MSIGEHYDERITLMLSEISRFSGGTGVSKIAHAPLLGITNTTAAALGIHAISARPLAIQGRDITVTISGAGISSP
jgi:hypothetical protein